MRTYDFLIMGALDPENYRLELLPESHGSAWPQLRLITTVWIKLRPINPQSFRSLSGHGIDPFGRASHQLDTGGQTLDNIRLSRHQLTTTAQLLTLRIPDEGAGQH